MKSKTTITTEVWQMTVVKPTGRGVDRGQAEADVYPETRPAIPETVSVEAYSISELEEERK